MPLMPRFFSRSLVIDETRSQTDMIRKVLSILRAKRTEFPPLNVVSFLHAAPD